MPYKILFQSLFNPHIRSRFIFDVFSSSNRIKYIINYSPSVHTNEQAASFIGPTVGCREMHPPVLTETNYKTCC